MIKIILTKTSWNWTKCGTHLVEIELSFLEKLGWLLKEAKHTQVAGQLHGYNHQENHSNAHGFDKTTRQDLKAIKCYVDF